jgi:uncharacterized coiled-coil protein SlyX
MEEDLASLSVSLRYARQRMAKMNEEIKSLYKRLDKKESETETKQPETETKATEVETEAVEPEEEQTQ